MALRAVLMIEHFSSIIPPHLPSHGLERQEYDDLDHSGTQACIEGNYVPNTSFSMLSRNG